MFKNKKVLFLFCTIFIFSFTFVNNVFASPAIASLLLNGSAESVTFNPNNGESISIEVKASVPVKFTRLYLCTIDQICNGTSGNYTRYFTQSDISDTITKTWNGKKSGDIEIVQDGEYKVMVSMTEGANPPITEFGKYSIFINSSSQASTTSNSNISSTTASTSLATNTTVVINNVYISAHSSTENLSNYSENTFETSAGRPRMALVGSILEFNAKYSISSKIPCTPSFHWVFGDGFESYAKDSTHSYKYAGEYNIILNATCGEYSSVSRTVAKIIKPNIAIVINLLGDVEVVNHGKEEINLGNWKIKGAQKDFIFPQDTIIFGKGNIILSKDSLLGIGDRVSINNPQDKEVVFYIKNLPSDASLSTQSVSNSNIQAVIEPQISVEMAESLLIDYKKSLGFKNRIINEIPKGVENKEDLDNRVVENTATVLEAVNTPANTGFWSRIINTPVKSVKKLFSRFYDF